jgi:hypothetical protein
VRTHSVDLMNKILNANDAKLAKCLQILTHHKIKLGMLCCYFKQLMLSIWVMQSAPSRSIHSTVHQTLQT